MLHRNQPSEFELDALVVVIVVAAVNVAPELIDAGEFLKSETLGLERAERSSQYLTLGGHLAPPMQPRLVLGPSRFRLCAPCGSRAITRALRSLRGNDLAAVQINDGRQIQLCSYIG